jgi:hypothetical protein
MSRFYQNVLTGKQVEVKSLEEDDYYQDNPANWVRIKALAPGKKVAEAPEAETPPAPRRDK